MSSFLMILCIRTPIWTVVCPTKLCVNPFSQEGDSGIEVGVTSSKASADISDEDMLVTLLVGQRSTAVTLENKK